jgi:hypothetical protein
MRYLRLLGIAAVLSAMFAVGPVRSDPPKEEKKADDKKGQPRPRLPQGHELMRAKLKASQDLLEALALADFKRMATAADELARIAKAAEFLNAAKSDEYQFQILSFRRSAEEAGRKARDKNLDGTLLAYQRMTQTCVQCHNHTRDLADVRPGLPPLPAGQSAAGR